MGKIIYMEQTMIMLMNSMKFATDALLEAHLEENYIEKETIDGILYYIKKES